MMVRYAVVSPDGFYRYVLTREWDADKPTLGWCCLNPSVADHVLDDRSLSRMVYFTMRQGYGKLVLCNIFGFRSQDPRALLRCADPIGPLNDKYMTQYLAGLNVVCGWGSGIPKRFAHRAIYVKLNLWNEGCRLYHLGLTKLGQPRHPLYLPNTTPFVEWEDERL